MRPRAQIKYKSGYKYQLVEEYRQFTNIYPTHDIVTDYVTLTTSGLLIIKKGYAWDGASGPTVDTSSSMRGSLVHDALYQLMRLNLLPLYYRENADHLLYSICVEDGMNPLRAEAWETAVNLFAEHCARPGTEKPIQIAPIFNE